MMLVLLLDNWYNNEILHHKTLPFQTSSNEQQRLYIRDAQPAGRIRPPKEFYPALGAG